MKKKRLSSLVRLVITCALCAVLCLSLFACGQKAPQYEAQSGVTYTQLMSDMNRPIAYNLSAVIPNTLWWGTVGGHVVVYGSNEDAPGGPQPHLLAQLDPESEKFTTVALALPEVPANTPGIAAALAAQQAAEAGTPLQRDAAVGYDVATRALVGMVENADEQLFLLLSDTLRHYIQGEKGYLEVAVTERAITLCNLSKNGVMQPVAQLQIPQEYLLLEDVAADSLIAADGSLWITAYDYFSGQGHLLRFSLTDGSLLSTLSLPKGTTLSAGGLTQLSDDRLLVLTQTTQADAETGSVSLLGSSFYVAENITSDKPAWQDPIDLPAALQNSSRSDFVPQLDSDLAADAPLLCNTTGVYRLQLATGEAEQVLNWVDFGVQADRLDAVFALGEGRYLVATQPDATVPGQVAVLTPLDPAVIASRTILTFGKTYFSGSVVTDPIREAIAKFNASSTEYYIQVVDYDQMAKLQGIGIGNGDILLNQAVIDNDVPDILMIPSSMSANLLRKGLTVDLYPYIDADLELSREDFLPNILALTEIDGKLPSVLASYNIETLLGDSALVGADMGWTWQEYQALCADNDNAAPIFRINRQNFLQMFLRRAGNAFVDRESNQAHFTSPDFVSLLESSLAYPTQIDVMAEWDPKPALTDKTALLVDSYLSCWDNALDSVYLFNDSYVYKGYPSDGSNTGSTVLSQLQLGISSSCQYPDVAWQLVRTFLLPDFQDNLGNDLIAHPGFPLRRDSLAASSQYNMTHSKLPSYLQMEPNVTKDMYITLTQQDVDKVLQLIESATIYNNYDDDISTIVAEEAEAFYNGQRTAEETAEIIQDRVQTYLDEQS